MTGPRRALPAGRGPEGQTSSSDGLCLRRKKEKEWALPVAEANWHAPETTLCPAPVGQESPKGGVGSPTGLARGAGREWALPVAEANWHAPETTLHFEGTKSPLRI